MSNDFAVRFLVELLEASTVRPVNVKLQVKTAETPIAVYVISLTDVGGWVAKLVGKRSARVAI